MHQGWQQNVTHQRALAAARNTRDGNETPKWDSHIDLFQIVLARALHDQRVGANRAALLGHFDRPLAREIRPGHRRRHLFDAFYDSAVHHGTAMFASTRPDIHDPIAGPNGVFVVLDDEHGVAQVAQSVQRVNQSMIVALVQTDGRLVQHVQRTHEPRANLAGQTNALGLTTGQSASRT